MKKIRGGGGGATNYMKYCWPQWLADEENVFHFKSPKRAKKPNICWR